MATFKSILSIVRMLTTGKEAGAMKEAFLAAAVCVLIFGAIAGITAPLATLLGIRINRRGRRKCDPPFSFVIDVLSRFG